MILLVRFAVESQESNSYFALLKIIGNLCECESLNGLLQIAFNSSW